MNPIQLFDTNLSSFTYLLFDESSRDALIIDPVDSQLERDLAPLRRYGLRLVWTEDTHAHADHIISAGLMAEYTGATTVAPAGCGIETDAMQSKDGASLRFGSEKIQALLTPGHDYRGCTQSAIGFEKTDNPRIAGKTLEQFIATMEFLNLPKPTRIEEAVPANVSSGIRHDANSTSEHPKDSLQARPATGFAGDINSHLAHQWCQAG